MYCFLLPLLLGFACNAFSAFTTAFSRQLGDRAGRAVTFILRNLLGIPLGVIGLSLAVRPSALFDVLMNLFAAEPQAVSSPDTAIPSAAGVPVSPVKPQLDPGMADSHPLRILLAEDNFVNQKLALRLLSQMGYRADLAANGLEVLESLERQPYDLVLMDVQMPEMDGLEATRRVRQRWPGGVPFIIAMTARPAWTPAWTTTLPSLYGWMSWLTRY